MATTTTTDVDAIRRRMAQIRMELHEDVRGVVAGAEAAFDWQYYIRLYPYAALGAAVVVGYLIVPKRRHRTRDAGQPQTVHQEVRSEKKEARRKSGLLGLAMGFLGPIAMRAAQNYAMNYVENWIQQQPFGVPGFAPGEPASTTAPSPGSSPGGQARGPYPA